MPYRFFLTHDAGQVEVDQPDKFESFESEIDRDFKTHGLIYQFTSGTLLLGFIGDGRDILERAFQIDGLDAIVTLQIDKRDDDADPWVTVFTGNAVMENRVISIDFFEVDFENTTFLQKLTNRFDTKVRLDATEDLDGGTLSGALTSYSVVSNNIRKKKVMNANYRDPADSAVKDDINTPSSSSGSTFTKYWKPFFESLQINELPTPSILPKTLVFTSSAPTTGDVVIEQIGDITFNATIKYQIKMLGICSDASPPSIIPSYSFVLDHYNSADALQTSFDRTTGGLSNWGETDSPITDECPSAPTNQDFTLQTRTLNELTITDVKIGDYFVFYLREKLVDSNGGNITAEFDADWFHNSSIDFSLKDAAKTFSTTQWLVFDVLERIVQIITGVNTAFWSDFYGVTESGADADGCGGLTMLTSGLRLRIQTTFPEMSLKDVLESLQAIHNIGWAVEDAYEGVDFRLRVELMEFFYADGEILDLGNVTKFKAETFEELTFNKVEIGYNKFSNEENGLSNSLDDFSTVSEYFLPLASVKGDYIKKSPFIASGELIQATFDQGLDLSKAWKYDEDIFIIQVVRSGGNFIPENDENFDSFTGVDDSTTAYNGRIAPVYMLVNHALILNSALLGVDIATKKYRNGSVKVNKSFSAEIADAFACNLKDTSVVRTSVGDILVSDMFNGLRLFEPTKHTFIVALTTAQFDTIIQALQGNFLAGNSKNWGYLTYTDEESNIQTGWVLNIKWSPVAEIATIETVERSDVYLSV